MWILITLVATTLQTARNTLSKQISKKVSAEAVSLARFLYALPVVTVIYFIASYYLGKAEVIDNSFYLLIFLFAASQALAQFLMVELFHYKNFAVSITFIKTSVIFTAILGVIFLGEDISLSSWLGVIISFFGLILASFARLQIKLKNLCAALSGISLYLGLLSAFGFAINVILAKQAMVFVSADFVIIKSIFALMIALGMEVLMLLPIAYFKDKKSLIAILKKPKFPALSGITGGLGTIFWFWAFNIATVAYVVAIGQIEFILSVLISVFLFREKIYKSEYIGMVLMIIGIVILVF